MNARDRALAGDTAVVRCGWHPRLVDRMMAGYLGASFFCCVLARHLTAADHRLAKTNIHHPRERGRLAHQLGIVIVVVAVDTRSAI